MALETHIIKAANSELFVRIHDSGHKEAIILLHGGPGIPDYLDEVATFLSRNFKVISFDQRGCGKSIAFDQSFSLKEYIYDIAEIADFFKLEQFHLFGHSWGGMLAQLYAVDQPGKLISLFLCNPSPGVGKQWKLMEKKVLDFYWPSMNTIDSIQMGINYFLVQLGGKLEDLVIKRIYKQVWRTYIKNINSTYKAEEEWLNNVNKKVLTDTRREIIKMDRSFLNRASSYSNLPVIFLYGSHDIYRETTYINKIRWPNAQYIELEDSGHLPWIQDRNNFRSVLSQFYDLGLTIV